MPLLVNTYLWLIHVMLGLDIGLSLIQYSESSASYSESQTFHISVKNHMDVILGLISDCIGEDNTIKGDCQSEDGPKAMLVTTRRLLHPTDVA